MSSMVLRWSTSKIVFSDPDLGSKWPPSAHIWENCLKVFSSETNLKQTIDFELNFNTHIANICKKKPQDN